MNKSFLAFSLLLSSVAFGAQFEVSGMSVSTSDFKKPTETLGNPYAEVEKKSVDGRCTLKRSDWTGEAWYSLYVYDKNDSDFQGSLAIRPIENGIELIASDDINENCSIAKSEQDGLTKAEVKCHRFGSRETVTISVDKSSIIKEISFSENEAGFGGHSIPAPYIHHKNLNCKF